MSRSLAILSSALSIVISGCLVDKELPVEYDYSYKGQFGKYDTFAFIDREAVFMQASPELKTSITSIIDSHMEFLGYKKKDNRPDLLLTFSVFRDSLRYQGYDQQDIIQWAKTKDRDLDYNSVDYKIKQGTIVIQLYDRKQNAAIWQGYATDEYRVVNLDNERDVRNAVKSILNKYMFFSQEFMKQQKELERNKKRNS